MTSRHLVSDRYLSLLRDINSYYLIYTCGKLVAVLVREYAYVNNDTRLTVRKSERGVSYLSCLLTEDRAKKSFLRGKLCLSLRSDLTDKNISGSYLSTLLYDTLCVEVLKRVLTDVRYLTGYLLRTELGVSCLVSLFENVDRGVNVVSYKSLVKKNSVLVVITLPGHKSDKSVLTERDLSV